MKFNKISFLTLILALALCGICFAASRDLASQLDVVSVITPGEYSTDQTSEVINGRNYRAHLLGIYVSVATYTESLGMEFNLSHCASSTGTFTAVDSSDMIGVTPSASGTIYTVDEEIFTAEYQEFLYVGGMPYLKLTMDMEGDHSSASPTISVVDVKGAKIISQ